MKKIITKKFMIIACVVVAIAFVVIIVNSRIAIGFNPVQDMRSFAVVTDKKEMNSVDKIVIETPKKSTTITDKSFIKRFCNKTAAPTSYPAKIGFGKNIAYLYHGEKLVRTMKIGEDGNYYAVVVLDENTPVYYIGRKVDFDMQELVTFSKSFADEMNAFLEADGNTFA